MIEDMSKVAFKAWPKIPRLRRGITITEKIDGTNAHINIVNIKGWWPFESPRPVSVIGDLLVFAGRRTGYCYQGDDNYGFAAWVAGNAPLLVELGEGRHYGEWWGVGIRRGYGLRERRFSLFNTKRWFSYPDEVRDKLRPIGVDCAPIVAESDFTDGAIEGALEDLRINGSKAAPGFMKPEGIVVFHKASGGMFKRTLENDEVPKGIE